MHSKCGFGYEEIDDIPLEYGWRMFNAYNTYIKTILDPLLEQSGSLKQGQVKPNFPPPPGAKYV